MPVQHVERAVIKAAVNDQAAAISTLLNFAISQGVEPYSIVPYYATEHSIRLGHASATKAMVTADPEIANVRLYHGIYVLDRAVKPLGTPVVAVLLQHGADPSPDYTEKRKGVGYPFSLLAWAAGHERQRMVQLLPEYGTPTTRSGALRSAAEQGSLDIVRLLMQHGADVNEQIKAEELPRYRYAHCVGRMAMHIAAASEYLDAGDKAETMKVLEMYGAHADVVDGKGKTAAQLLGEWQMDDEDTRA